ncbi:hypothetical protein LQW54_002022 [Pestalotiopsis sp. IQ-011]
MTEPVRTILHHPASEKSIAALDRKLRDNGFPCGMPNDLAALYRVTNGIFDKRDGNNTEIFLPIEEVEIIRDSYPWICELLPPLDNAPEAVSHILWPEIKKGVHLGPGGDWGMQLLVPPETTRRAVAIAEQAWQDGDCETRRHLENIAVMDAIDNWAMGDSGNGGDDNSQQRVFDEECDELKGKEFDDHDAICKIVYDGKAAGCTCDDDAAIAVVEYLDGDALKTPNVISARRIQGIHCQTKKNKTRRLSTDYVAVENNTPAPNFEQTMHLDLVTVDEHGALAFIGDNDLI